MERKESIFELERLVCTPESRSDEGLQITGELARQTLNLAKDGVIFVEVSYNSVHTRGHSLYKETALRVSDSRLADLSNLISNPTEKPEEITEYHETNGFGESAHKGRRWMEKTIEELVYRTLDKSEKKMSISWGEFLKLGKPEVVIRVIDYSTLNELSRYL